MFVLEHICDNCGTKRRLTYASAIDFPTDQPLWELLVGTEDSHTCPKPAPPLEDPDRTPY